MHSQQQSAQMRLEQQSQAEQKEPEPFAVRYPPPYCSPVCVMRRFASRYSTP